MDQVIQLVTGLGFPIAACLILMFYVKYINDQRTDEVAKLRDVLERNTLVIQRLADRLGGDNDVTKDE